MDQNEKKDRKKAIIEYLDSLSLEILQKMEELISKKDELIEKLFS